MRRNAAESGLFTSISGTGQERLIFLAERVRICDALKDFIKISHLVRELIILV